MIIIDDNGYNIRTNNPHVFDFMNLLENKWILILRNSGQDNKQSYTTNSIPLDHNSGKGKVFHFVEDEWYRMQILNVNARLHHSQDYIHFSKSCTSHTLAHD